MMIAEDDKQQPIYLDYNATTPLHPLVVQAMIPYLSDSNLFGNPSSSHSYGLKARQAVEQARKQTALLLGCNIDEIMFTSGGSESNNHAIKGLAAKMKDRKHIITSKVEHVSVLEVCKYMEVELGYAVTYLNVDSEGFIDMDQLTQSLTPETLMVTIMHANNETGTIQPIEKIGRILNEYETKTGVKVYLHTDASQTIGKIPFSLYSELSPAVSSDSPLIFSNFSSVDLLTVCSHKFYGPKGIGALFIRRNTVNGKLVKQIHGANHEQNLRAGTENVLEIVGLGKACEVSAHELSQRIRHMSSLRDRLYDKLVEHLGSSKYIVLNGPQDSSRRLPNTLNISFINVESNTLLDEVGDRIAASAGAACHTDDISISHVLEAMNVPLERALGAIRLSTGRLLTETDIDNAAEIIASVVQRLQPVSDDRNEDDELCEIESKSRGTVRLTSMTHGLGCGCKIRPQSLEKILKNIPRQVDGNVLVGTETSDDAGVYKLSDEIATVCTVDFFTPMVDSAKDFGAIACSNALSDVYAMGGKPLAALNIVGFPVRRLPLSILQEILLGAQEKCKEAGVSIIGGHSIEDPEMFFGQSVTGIIHPDKIWRNSGSKPGDVLLISKPIGVGIITTAMKRSVVKPDSDMGRTAIRTMSQLNKRASEILIEENVSVTACTDVTGFGLMGHLKEMIASNPDINAHIDVSQVPLIDGVQDLAMIPSLVPGGTSNNKLFVQDFVYYDHSVSDVDKTVLCDAQTSGGLLFTIPAEQCASLLQNFNQQGVFVKKIGYIEKRTDYNSTVQIYVSK